MRKTVQLTIISLLFASAAWAQENKTTKMIHIDFKDTREEGMELVMSLPLSVITSFHPQIREAFTALEEENQSLDFVEIWSSIKEIGPHDFLEIKGEDGHVKLSTTESHFVAKVNSPEDGEIEALVPLALGDVLFAKAESFDFDAILAALELLDGQDLITIRSEFINGRVWIE